MFKNILPAVILIVIIGLGLATAGERLRSWGRAAPSAPAPLTAPDSGVAPASFEGAVQPSNSPLPAPLPATPVGTSPVIDVNAGHPEGDCLIDANGIRRKALVVRASVQATRTRGGTDAVGLPLRYFWPQFVFQVEPPTGEPTAYLVGTSPARKDVVGWVAAADVTPWNTRVGARHVRNADRAMPLIVYAERASLVQLIETGHTEGLPLARATRSATWRRMPWPILEVDYHEFNGRTYELCKLAFVGEAKPSPTTAATTTTAPVPAPAQGTQPRPYSDAQIQAMYNDLVTLEVVFCVDNTISTQPYLDAIRTTVNQIAEQLRSKAQAARIELRLGLVLYRDYVPSIMFKDDRGAPTPVSVYPLQSEIDQFINRVNTLGVAPFDSVDEPEAVYDGVKAALTRAGWSGGVLSRRVVVLLGDDAAHEPGDVRNPENLSSDDLIRTARSMSPPVTIEALCLDQYNTPQAREVHLRQFSKLAVGTGGHCQANEQFAHVAATLERLMDGMKRTSEVRGGVFRAKAEGQTVAETARALDLDIHEVTEVLEFLEGAGVDLRGLAPGVPSFATGWCLAEVSGEPVLEKSVYVLRSELMLLNAELSRLSTFLEPRQVGEVADVAAWGRVDPASFFAQQGKAVMNRHLIARGIPCRKGGLLEISRDDLDHLSEEARGDLRKQIGGHYIPKIVEAINDTRYFAESEPLEPGWVPESIFP